MNKKLLLQRVNDLLAERPVVLFKKDLQRNNQIFFVSKEAYHQSQLEKLKEVCKDQNDSLILKSKEYLSKQESVKQMCNNLSALYNQD